MVAKDSDFNDIAVRYGPPPHVVWIRRGSCTTDAIEALLRGHCDAILALDGPETAVLMLA